MKLNDPLNVRTWEYTATSPNSSWRGERHLINENLTGAVLGDQRPARITFRMALWILHGWSQITNLKFHLVIPNPPQEPQKPEPWRYQWD